MALTPDDVVNKQFQHVRFKDGFDPDEVDDFLDEIVVEWRKALEENADLKAKLAAYESGEAPAAAAAVTPAEPTAVADTAVVNEVPVAAPAAEGDDAKRPALSTTATAGIIELAQRLHDEHVAEGEAKRSQLITEAETEVERIRSEAAAKHQEESTRLEAERTALESKIAELKKFEHDYRTKLRDYIEGQLRDLDGQAPNLSAASSTGQ